MPPETIQALLTRKPFGPFSVHTWGGRGHRVTDPDLVRISPTTLTLLAAGPGTGTSRVADIDIASVTSLTLDAPTTEAP
jgi:hypothetical protein